MRMNETDLMFKEAFEYLKPFWEPKETDLAFKVNEDNEYFPLENLCECPAWDDPTELKFKKLVENNEIIWKPRIEDLIQIIINDFKGENTPYAPTEIIVLRDFYKNTVPNKNDLNDKRPLNELFLIYIMELMFSKQWNGSSWEVM